MPKVMIDHDAASSHTARKTQAYAAEVNKRIGITIISNKDISVKFPDASRLRIFRVRLSQATPFSEAGKNRKRSLETYEGVEED